MAKKTKRNQGEFDKTTISVFNISAIAINAELKEFGEKNPGDSTSKAGVIHQLMLSSGFYEKHGIYSKEVA